MINKFKVQSSKFESKSLSTFCLLRETMDKRLRTEFVHG